jgi:hypothetical protein
MKMIKYNTLEELWKAAKKFNKEIFESNIRYSFRIYENKKTSEFHYCEK